MWEALLWGAIAGSASLIGAVLLMLIPVKADHRLYHGPWYRGIDWFHLL